MHKYDAKTLAGWCSQLDDLHALLRGLQARAQESFFNGQILSKRDAAEIKRLSGVSKRILADRQNG